MFDLVCFRNDDIYMYLSGSRLSLSSQYWIPRVRLMFTAEDPEVFAKRVADAFRKRRNTESLLRYVNMSINIYLYKILDE